MILIGELSLWVALLMAAWTTTVSFSGGMQGRQDLIKSGERAMNATFGFTVLASVGIWTALFSHDFSIKFVATPLDVQKIVVREVAPLLLQFALELFPFAFELILVDDPRPKVRRITLNRPEKRNPLSNALRTELFEALDSADRDPAVAVTIIRGAGSSFCAGYDLKSNVAEGQPLSQSLAIYAEYFSPFDLAMLEAGELVGHLDDSLKRVSAYRESQQRLISKIRGALAYPLFVTLAGIAAIIFMLSFVMPKFSAFFLDLGQQLPLMTRLLIGASQIAEKIWPMIIGGSIFIYFVFAQSLKADGNRLGWHRFYLGLPKVGQLIVYSQFARFSRTLSLLLESGIPLLKALQTSLPVVTNQVIRSEIQNCHAAIIEGGSFAESLSRSHWVPSFVTQLIRAGEASGRLQESLNDIADWYEQELQENMEVTTKLLEPILILVVGSILGVMVIAVLLPIFSMNAAVS